jgi:hypothetical protein
MRHFYNFSANSVVGNERILPCLDFLSQNPHPLEEAVMSVLSLDDPITSARRDLMCLSANRIAGYMHNQGRHIKAVDIFGSVARRDCSLKSDFDLIVCTNRFTAALWRLRLAQLSAKEAGYHLASLRRQAAFDVLGLDPMVVLLTTGVSPWKMDIFLFPQNWRKKLTQLQAQFDHHDPDFMKKIAHDARTYVPGQGFAFPIR